MQCPKCAGDTSVVDSRAAPNNTIRRRRECDACGHRFNTFESTVSPQVVIKHRQAQAVRKQRWWANMSPEMRRAHKLREHRRAEARCEAKETGEPVEALYRRWGVE